MKLNIGLLIAFTGLPLISLAESDDARITKLEDEVKKLQDANEEMQKKLNERPVPMIRRRVVPTQSTQQPVKEEEPKEIEENFQGHSYKFIPVKKSWHLAKTDASKRGGYLAVIDTEEENTFINNLIMKASSGAYVRTWIGLNNDNEDHKWEWVNGSKTSYQNWGPGEPNSPDECSGHLGLYGGDPNWEGKWNNVGSDCQMYYVVESEDIKK